MSPRANKGLVFVLGALFAVLLLEGGLRLVGHFYIARLEASRPAPVADDGRPLIMCYGDSFTEGVGAEQGNGYPEQLKKLLDSDGSLGDVQVINRGYGASNTTLILGRIRADLKRYKPDLVIVLAGGHNFWNFYGYHTHVGGEGPATAALDWLSRIRVYRLARSLLFEAQSGEDQAAPWWAGGAARAQLETGEANTGGGEHEPTPAMPDYLGEAIDRADDLYSDDRHDAALAVLQGVMRKLTGGKHDGCHGFADDGHEPERLIHLSLLHLRLGQVLAEGGHKARALTCARALEAAPPPGFSARLEVAQLYNSLDATEKVTFSWIEKAMASKVIGENLSLDHCTALATSAHSPRSYDAVHRFLSRHASVNRFAASFAAAVARRKQVNEDGWGRTLAEWAASDLEQMIQECKRRQVKLFILEYPKLCEMKRHLTITYQPVARRHGVPFVRVAPRFEKLLSDGASVEDYFVPDLHCNDRGYGVMAKIVFEEIKKRGVLQPPGAR